MQVLLQCIQHVVNDVANLSVSLSVRNISFRNISLCMLITFLVHIFKIHYIGKLYQVYGEVKYAKRADFKRNATYLFT